MTTVYDIAEFLKISGRVKDIHGTIGFAYKGVYVKEQGRFIAYGDGKPLSKCEDLHVHLLKFFSCDINRITTDHLLDVLDGAKYISPYEISWKNASIKAKEDYFHVDVDSTKIYLISKKDPLDEIIRRIENLIRGSNANFSDKYLHAGVLTSTESGAEIELSDMLSNFNVGQKFNVYLVPVAIITVKEQ